MRQWLFATRCEKSLLQKGTTIRAVDRRYYVKHEDVSLHLPSYRCLNRIMKLFDRRFFGEKRCGAGFEHLSLIFTAHVD